MQDQIAPPSRPLRRPLPALLAGLLLVAACAVAPPGAEIHDPYEASNREAHRINKALDSAVSTPGATRRPVPEEIALPVSNFAANAGLPSAILNGLLQGDVGGAATNTFRFLVNSTVGVGGLLDPAGAIGLAEEETDFGETLHVWGVPEGAYLEVVGLGPTTERDLAGRVVDTALDPFGRLVPREVRAAALAARVGDGIIDRRQFGTTVDDVLYGSADSYAQTRLIYLQNRRFELGMEPPGANMEGEGAIDPFALDMEGFE